MDGTFEGLRFDYKADLFMKKPIALIGCMDLFSQRVQRTLSAEFPQNDIKFFDTLSAARTYAGDAGPMSRFEMVLIDAPTFMDLMLDGTLSSTTEDGTKLAIAYENDAVHEHLLDRYREAISKHGISLLPMHTTLEAWLCMLGLVGNGVQFVPASAALQSAHTASRAMESYDTQDESNEPLPRLTKRESEVLRAIAGGKPNKLIAVDLEISEHTVKLHIHRVISKLGVTNRTEAAAFYFKNPEAYS